MKQKIGLLITLIFLLGMLSVPTFADPWGRALPGYSNWEYRVDYGQGSQPHHAHVRNKNTGKESSEGVNGTNSHGTNFNRDGIPSDVQAKVRSQSDYQRAKSDQDIKDSQGKISPTLPSTSGYVVGAIIVVAACVLVLCLFPALSPYALWVFAL
ncbi:MAG TPA: hypothetical protein VEF53_04875 [Patescibacteria group bacterium]|nr:hypothetical protein [Patescibacteria group bacterium]